MGPIKGKEAKTIERNILNYLKSQKVVFAHKAGGKKFDGWTEAWKASSLEVKSLGRLIRLTEKFEES
jgi:hypothetical protein